MRVNGLARRTPPATCLPHPSWFRGNGSHAAFGQGPLHRRSEDLDLSCASVGNGVRQDGDGLCACNGSLDGQVGFKGRKARPEVCARRRAD